MMRVLLAPAAVERRHITALMSGFSVETTPRVAATIRHFGEHLRQDCAVYITLVPGSDFNETIALAVRLRKEGFQPVPHLAARSITSKAVLESHLRRLSEEAGVSQALLIAGGMRHPVGEFSDTLQLLDTGLFDKYGVRRIGVAGHPEGSPDIPEEALSEALRWKTDFAARTGADIHIVTQFCFEPDPIIRWDRHIRAEGSTLPIRIGIPGPASIKTLITYAKACGIGPSIRSLMGSSMNVAKLLTVSAPDRLIAALASYRANEPACGIRGVHIYPFGGLRQSAEWAYAVADGRYTLSRDGTRFTVDTSAEGNDTADTAFLDSGSAHQPTSAGTTKRPA